MRSVKREAKGISPVIATILLIAVTAVAGGVIAAYVSGLYVGGGRVIIASADGSVYDYDNTAALENYKNGVASITVILQPGSERIRSIGDPAYGGTIIAVSNPASGFSGTVTFDNTSDWGGTMRKQTDIDIAAWGTDETNDVEMIVTMSPDSQGRLSAGGLISILLQPFGYDDAHKIIYVDGTDNDIRDNRMANAGLWDELQTFNVTITGRDSVSLTGYDGAYLMGSSWID